MIIQYNRSAGTCTVSREGFADVVLSLASPTLEADIAALAAEYEQALAPPPPSNEPPPLPSNIAGWAARGWLRQEGMYDLVRTKAFALGGELMVARLEADRWIVEHLLGLCGHIGMTPEQAEVVVRAIHAEESKSPS